MPINLKDIPSGVLPVFVRHAGLGATADSEIAVFYADKAYKIIAAGYLPDAAMSGATATARSLAFINKGTAGAGTTAIKTAKAYTVGVDLVAYDYDELISASDAKTIAAGEVVSFAGTHASTGTALPAGSVVLLLWPISE
jgi:hypothetical protein